MSFIKSLKNAFGFDDAESQEAELEGIDATVVPLKDRAEAHVEAEADGETDGQTSDTSVPDEVAETPLSAEALTATQSIFQTVVKVFNDSLPEFLKQSVNEKSQCEYIYSQLDESIKLYLEQVAADARRQVAGRWEAERKQLMAQMSTLRTKMQKDEEDTAEIKKQQLSAERQKRALGDRVRDLEAQLHKAEAEMEQLSLENKSMANKIRVNAVLGTSEGETEAEAVEAMATQISELTASVEASKNELNQAIEDKGALEKELQQLKEALKASEDKCEAVQAEKNELSQQLESRQEELNDALENLEIVEEMQTQLNQLQEARNNYEAAIKKERDALQASEDKCNALENANSELAREIEIKESSMRRLEDIADSLQKTIEKNLYEHAQMQSAMRAEINKLKEQLEAKNSQTVNLGGELGSGLKGSDAFTDLTRSATSRNGSDPKPSSKPVIISAIDESIEDTDWLVSTPPEVKKSDEADEDFGYKNPQKGKNTENPDQMLLF